MKKYLLYLVLFVLISCKTDQITEPVKFEGNALGTTFHITYQDVRGRVLDKQVDSLIHAVNRSLSTYLPDSDISRINKGEITVKVDEMFEEVFEKSKRIFHETEGIFDPTIGVLVNAWGFGPGKEIVSLDSAKIRQLMRSVNFDKVKIRNGMVKKTFQQTYLDFNAIAKGYAVDVLGRYFESQGIENYLVEIGGEIRARGKNSSGKLWKIAIEKPNFDGSRSFMQYINLNDESIATSGNYRKYKIDQKTGKKYAHTIDTKTGFPSKSNLLSASVISKLDCADVDGYATALMAMGLDKSKEFLEEHPELKSFLIYSDHKGEMHTFKTANLKMAE